MANPYRDAGYASDLLSDPDATGDYLAITRNGEVVAEVAVTLGSPGEEARIVIKRFKQGELRQVVVLDEFEG